MCPRGLAVGTRPCRIACDYGTIGRFGRFCKRERWAPGSMRSASERYKLLKRHLQGPRDYGPGHPAVIGQ